MYFKGSYFTIQKSTRGKCIICPFREGCYKPGAKRKARAIPSLSIKTDEHSEETKIQETGCSKKSK